MTPIDRLGFARRLVFVPLTALTLRLVLFFSTSEPSIPPLLLASTSFCAPPQSRVFDPMVDFNPTLTRRGTLGSLSFSGRGLIPRKSFHRPGSYSHPIGRTRRGRWRGMDPQSDSAGRPSRPLGPPPHRADHLTFPVLQLSCPQLLLVAVFRAEYRNSSASSPRSPSETLLSSLSASRAAGRDSSRRTTFHRPAAEYFNCFRERLRDAAGGIFAGRARLPARRLASANPPRPITSCRVRICRACPLAASSQLRSGDSMGFSVPHLNVSGGCLFI